MVAGCRLAHLLIVLYGKLCLISLNEYSGLTPLKCFDELLNLQMSHSCKLPIKIRKRSTLTYISPDLLNINLSPPAPKKEAHIWWDKICPPYDDSYFCIRINCFLVFWFLFLFVFLIKNEHKVMCIFNNSQTTNGNMGIKIWSGN